jgi:NitT/TauT family transport system ATP-binding protein
MPPADLPPSHLSGPAVSLRGVGKSFSGGVTALAGLDLDIHDGEFVTLLGASGCGKSTALRIIAGLTEPTEGEITRSGATSGGIGFVFQDPTLMPWANVRRNVSLPLRLAGREAESKDRIDAALAQVGLSGFSENYPRELSGGMRMRVSIARALSTEPDLLLMDEPFAALDEITRFRLNNDLLALWHARRRTTVFVTHSVFESVYLSSRIVVMTARPGRVFTEIEIDAPYPRGDFRTSADYAAACRKVSGALEQAMNAGGA